MHFDVAIITVSTNQLSEDCLASVRMLIDSTPLKVGFVLVDNASTVFNAHELVKRHVPEAIVILRDDNYGFGSSCNRGAREVDADYYFFLNPDTRIEDKDALSNLCAFMKKYPQVGIVAPKILYMDGKLQETCRRFPAWFTPIAQRTSIMDEEKSSDHSSQFLMEDFEHNKHRMVDWVQGSAFMIESKLFFEIGGFDERYFMYYEDVDLCRNCWKRGRPVYYLPEAVIYHVYGKESSVGDSTWNRIVRNPKTRTHILSWIKYTLKWFGEKI